MNIEFKNFVDSMFEKSAHALMDGDKDEHFRHRTIICGMWRSALILGHKEECAYVDKAYSALITLYEKQSKAA